MKNTTLYIILRLATLISWITLECISNLGTIYLLTGCLHFYCNAFQIPLRQLLIYIVLVGPGVSPESFLSESIVSLSLTLSLQTNHSISARNKKSSDSHTI